LENEPVGVGQYHRNGGSVSPKYPAVRQE